MQCTIRKKEERKEKVERGRSLGTFAVLGLVLGFAGREGSLDNNGAGTDDEEDGMNLEVPVLEGLRKRDK